MAATTFMNEESFYHTSFNFQDPESSPNAYYQVPSISDNSNDVYLTEQDMEPFLEILVHPCDKFRFRYCSEAGSHGKVRGPEKNRSKTNFPTVKLHSRDSFPDKIEVKASLYTHEPNPRPHILELVGKNCRLGGCWETLSDDDTAMFRFLEIENKRKEEAVQLLMERMKKHAGRRFNKEKLREEALEEYKLLDMNCVILCFEAFQNGNPISGKVFSTPIKNLKSTSSDLKITRISSCSGSCKGGDDVILLCEKINKDDIEIHFYEKDDNDTVLWREKAEFNPKVDVHHQVAIAFKTPAYKNNSVGTVFMELHRRSDNQSSEPRIFTYIPDEIDSLRDSKKRRRENSYESIDSGIGQASTSSGYCSSTPVSPMEHFPGYTGIPQQDDDGNSLWPTGSGEELLDAETAKLLFSMVDADKLFSLNSSTERVAGQIYADSAEPVNLYAKEIMQPIAHGEMYCNGSIKQYGKEIQPTAQTEMYDEDYSDLLTGSTLQDNDFDGGTGFYFDDISMLPPEPPEETAISKHHNDHDYLMRGSRQENRDSGRICQTSSSNNFSLMNAISDGFNYLKNILPSQEEENWEQPCSGGLGLTSVMKALIPRRSHSNDTKSTESMSKDRKNGSSANRAYEPEREQFYAQSALCIDMTNLSIEDEDPKQSVAFKSLNHVEYQSSISTDSKENKSSINEVEINKNFEHFKESINRIMRNREEGVYLEYISKLMSVTDKEGNTFLHLAVKEQNENTNLIAKIIQMCPESVNKQNNFKETPLHLATNINAHKIVLMLLLKNGNPSIVNAKGNNCFHLASTFNCIDTMKFLLIPSLKYGKHIPSVDQVNYEGLVPLHLAILNNAKACLKLLLQAGADVNVKDRKSGRTPVMFALKHQPSLVQDFLHHPLIDLLSQDFQGDTFIHALCNMKGLPMPRISHSKELVIWASKALALDTVCRCETSSSSSGTEYSDEESDNDEDTIAHARVYSALTQSPTVNNGDQNCLNEECEECLMSYLDTSSGWRKLGLSIGLSEKTLDGLATLSKNSSPSRVILKKIKVLYKNCDKQTLINILEEADLKEAANILK